MYSCDTLYTAGPLLLLHLLIFLPVPFDFCFGNALLCIEVQDSASKLSLSAFPHTPVRGVGNCPGRSAKSTLCRDADFIHMKQVPLSVLAAEKRDLFT